MLHNTETFDKKEVPIIQNNQNILSSENKIISSNNNLSETNEPGQMHFSAPYHVNLGLSQYNPELEANVQSYRNSMIPMNLNIQNESLISFHPYEKSHTNDKSTLNLPKVYTKTYHKQMDIDYDYINSYKKSTYDLNNTNKSTPRALSLCKQSEDIRISSDCNRHIGEVTINQDSSYQIQSDLSKTPINNVNTNSITDLSNKFLKADSKQRLANTVKMIENIISHPSNSRKIKPERKSKSKESKVLSSETSNSELISSGSIDNLKIKKNRKLKPNITTQKKIIHETVKSKSQICDDGKVGNDINAVAIAGNVPSVLNYDQVNIFLKDVHGVQEGTQNCDVIGAESSISVAKEVIKTGSTPIPTFFECPYCKLLFSNTKRFLIHTKWHTFGYITEKRCRSQRENIVKPRSRKYKKCESVQHDETDEGPITCGDCKRLFASTASLMNHRRKYHTTRLRECKICGKTVAGLAVLRAHIATHTTESRFQCDACPKWFKYSHSLAKHRDTHLEKTHECPQCPKKFGSIALLNVHMKTHERILRGATYSCTYCGKGFFESYSLQAHERTHRNERPFLCEICNTSFGTNSSLKRHLKVSHSTSKPYECNTCHRSFISESIRDRHSIRYHGNPEEFKFLCKLCPCKYLNARELKRHIYKVHPKPKMKIEVDSD